MTIFERPEIKITIPSSVKLYEDVKYNELHERNTLHIMCPSNSTKNLPLIIYIHGGAWNHGTKDLQIPHLLPYVESGNYIAAAINYRFSHHAPWPAQNEDCLNALQYLINNSQNFGIDTSRIAIWGSSSGAHLSLHLADHPQVKAILAYCPPSHFRPLLEIFENDEHELKDHIHPDSPVMQLVGQNPNTQKQLLIDSSPYEHLNSNCCPILLAHGTNDEAVPYEQSLAYSQKAKSLGLDCKLITLTGYEHKFIHPELDLIVKEFFDFHLLNHGNPPQDLELK